MNGCRESKYWRAPAWAGCSGRACWDRVLRPGQLREWRRGPDLKGERAVTSPELEKEYRVQRAQRAPRKEPEVFKNLNGGEGEVGAFQVGP